MKVHTCACAVLLSTALTASAGERLTIAVSPVQSFAPTNVMIRAHVPSDANNRGLEVTADSGQYFRSSWVQLDGNDAPQTITVEIRNLPAGSYEIRGALIDTTGRACAFARRQVIVLSSLGGG
jgi:hypothetical protein